MKIQEASKSVMDATAVFAMVLSSAALPQQLPFSLKLIAYKDCGYGLASNQFASLTGEGYRAQPFFNQILTNCTSSLISSNAIETEFERLAAKWKAERRASSSTQAIAMHPAYQKIIGMGAQAVPFILADLQRGVDHWFWALRSITRENPVPSESRGKMQEMANAWLDWGRKNGYA
jgi:ribosome-associated toxin RatA of RatAB toxin-antitoxin module